MNRVLALLVAIAGGAIAALGVVIVVGGGLLGMLWLYVFGDDLWPASAERFLNLAIPLAGLFLWGVFGWIIWRRLASPPEAG